MKYEYFRIKNYRAIKGPLLIDLRTRSLIPLIGLNECGKTTVLQAIFSFDSVNDEEYSGRHISEVQNLYQTRSATPFIAAGIRNSQKNWRVIASKYIADEKNEVSEKLSKAEEDGLDENAEEGPGYFRGRLEMLRKWSASFEALLASGNEVLEIERNLISLQYRIIGFSEVDEDFSNDFCHHLLSLMPYILYNDDFQDRPPSELIISKKTSAKSPWLAIFEKLFEVASVGYSLYQTAAVDDQRRRDSIVSDVQATLNRTLSKAWKSFHLDRNKKVKIRLGLIPFGAGDVAKLSVSIVENIGENERFFEVVDRSKGFLWFYNFVMKTEFNPKNLTGRSATVYLLDEPGSYLHSAAQIKLCEKLKQISKNNGKIIYCTHSPHLLSPDSIPINDIHIVSKGTNKEITVDRLHEIKTNGEKLVALQPMYEALQINGQQFSGGVKPMVAVEGIYDKYAIGLFVRGSKRFDLLPGTSANSIVKNIQFLNAFGIGYVAVWDNDKEGRKEFQRAKDAYGAVESKRFILLPDVNGKNNTRMEDFFLEEDLDGFRTLLRLESNSSYESTMVALFYASDEIKSKAVAGVSDHLTTSFSKLAANIEACLKL